MFKKIILSVCIYCLSLLMISCEDSTSTNDTVTDLANEALTLLNQKITSDLTLTNDKIWTIDGIVSVEDGATLGISAGTIIKFKPTIYDALGNITEISSLVISQTGKINATGSLNRPIIFTTTADNIQVGQKQGTNLTVTEKGKWGGIFICGQSTITDTSSSSSVSLIPNTSSSFSYGGSDLAHDSGKFSYVSIRHSGEENSGGLTLAGVGNSTNLNNIEVTSTKGSGYKFMGGAVNCNKCITSAHSESGIKISKGYSGTIETFAIIQTEDSGDALDITGVNSSSSASTPEFILNNGTIVGNTQSATSKIGSIKDEVKGKIKNIFITKFESAINKLDVNSTAASSISNNDIQFENIELNLNSASTLSTVIDDSISNQSSFTTNFSSISDTITNTVGIFPIVFQWTQSEETSLIPTDAINPSGEDTDNDGMGNILDTDDDDDGVADNIDSDPVDPTKLADTDQDGLPDSEDVFPNDPNIVKTLEDIKALIESGNYFTITDNSPETNSLKLQFVHASLANLASISQIDTINKYFYKYAIDTSSISDNTLNTPEYMSLFKEYQLILDNILDTYAEDSQISYTYTMFLEEYNALNLSDVSSYDLFLVNYTIWQFCLAIYSSDNTISTNASTFYFELASYLNTKLSTTEFTTGKLIPESIADVGTTASSALNSFKLSNTYLRMLDAYPKYATYSKDLDFDRFTNLLYLLLAKHYQINPLQISTYLSKIKDYTNTNNLQTLFDSIESTIEQEKDKKENRIPLQMISKVEKSIQAIATELGLSFK